MKQLTSNFERGDGFVKIDEMTPKEIRRSSIAIIILLAIVYAVLVRLTYLSAVDSGWTSKSVCLFAIVIVGWPLFSFGMYKMAFFFARTSDHVIVGADGLRVEHEVEWKSRHLARCVIPWADITRVDNEIEYMRREWLHWVIVVLSDGRQLSFLTRKGKEIFDAVDLFAPGLTSQLQSRDEYFEKHTAFRRFTKAYLFFLGISIVFLILFFIKKVLLE